MILIIIKLLDFCFEFLQELIMVCEAENQTLQRVFHSISETRRRWLKLGCASFFQNPHLGVWKSFDILPKTPWNPSRHPNAALGNSTSRGGG